MARQIQSQSNRPLGGKAVLGQLANAVFWVVVAFAVPIEEFLRPFPEFAPYAHWAPILFYVLAVWSFLRAVRTPLHRGSRPRQLPDFHTKGNSSCFQKPLGT